MATLKELRDERLRKLHELQALGFNPYPASSTRTHKINDIHTGFDQVENQEVTVVGRLVATRKFGKLAFLVLRDMSGQIQLFLKSDTVADTDAGQSRLGMSQLNLLDPGDFVQAKGPVIRTKTGEISVDVRELRLLKYIQSVLLP